MREILFRGKRLDNGEWVYGYYVELKYDGGKLGKCGFIYPCAEADYISVAVDPKTIEQYTGLTANGKKIFEGDIIKISGRSSFYAEVTYSEDSTSYWVENKNLEYFAELGSIKPSFIEVIGNVIDNPGLLKTSYFYREDKI